MIYIGIPVHNERHTIGPLLWRIREILYGERREFHVIVCDDASDDGTAEALARYPRVLPLTLLRIDARVGTAACLERLVREAVRRSGYPRRDALVTMQADFSDPPECISEMLRRFEGGADVVTVTPPGVLPRSQRYARLGGRLLGPKLAAAGIEADPYGSQRLYRLFTLLRASDDLAPGSPLLQHRGWAANAELLLKVWPHVRRIEEVDALAPGVRRYRDSRFEALAQIGALFRAGRDPVLKAALKRARADATTA